MLLATYYQTYKHLVAIIGYFDGSIKLKPLLIEVYFSTMTRLLYNLNQNRTNDIVNCAQKQVGEIIWHTYCWRS